MTALQTADAVPFSGDDPSLPASPLSREYYTSREWFERDMERVFLTRWLFAGHSTQIAAPGQFLAFELAGERVMVSRGSTGELTAVPDSRRQQPSVDRDTKRSSPRPVWLEEWNGMIFLALSDERPRSVAQAMAKADFSDFELARTKVIADRTYVVEANWKIVAETFSECYHCAIIHPEFCKIADALGDLESWDDVAMDDDLGHPGDYLIFSPDLGPSMLNGALTLSADGRLLCQRRLGSEGRHPTENAMVFWYPQFGLDAMPDYAVTFSWLPTGPTTSVFRSTWLVHEGAVEGVDYDVTNLVHFMDHINEEDKEITRIAQLGVNSKAYDNSAPYHRVFEGPTRGLVRTYLKHVSD